MSTIYYASSAGGRGTNTNCDYVSATRGICCERHRIEADDITRASAEAGGQPRENLRHLDMTLAERRAVVLGQDIRETRETRIETLRNAAESAALSGDAGALESYLDFLRESA